MVYETTVTIGSRELRVFDSKRSSEITLLWHTGSPQTGALLDPVLEAADARKLRLVSYGRPGYGSTEQAGRSVADAANDVRAIVESLGIHRLLTMGASGGGPHALATAALLPHIVEAVATLASPAPYSTEYEWFAGMADEGALRSALEGREARAAFALVEEFDPTSFIAADYAALEGRWASLGDDVGRAQAFGPAGLIDDDVAFAHGWGFDLKDVAAPALLIQGALDRIVPVSHGHALARELPGAELLVSPDDGHVSVMNFVDEAIDWMLARTS